MNENCQIKIISTESAKSIRPVKIFKSNPVAKKKKSLTTLNKLKSVITTLKNGTFSTKKFSGLRSRCATPFI